MKTKKIENLTGFRNPSEMEIQWVSRYFHEYYKKGIKVSKRISSLLCVVGIMFFSSYLSLGIPGLILGTVFFALSARLIWEKKKYQQWERLYKDGKFRVLDGAISDVSTDTTTVNQDSVKFVSKWGQYLDIWFGVRTKDLRVGTELLLVYVDSSEIKGGSAHVFTPDMLTEEGIRHTL